MSYFVEEIRHKYGLLDRPKKPCMVEGEVIGRYRWRLLRNCIRNVANELQKLDKKEYHVTHGIQFEKSLPHTHEIVQIFSIPKSMEFLTIDRHYIRKFFWDGRKKDVVTMSSIKCENLILATSVNQYVGWTKNENNLVILNDEFEIVSETATNNGFLNVIYNAERGEMISLERGLLISWVFRYGNRFLISHKQIPLDHNDELSLITLENTASHTQKVFVAKDKGVQIFNFKLGVCLYKKMNLHEENITALNFFNPMKYLITGARDGSIKVWNEAFHVVCVFVGHHDVVNNIVIYPFGPIILSSSFDKTLRVWSLEICDEVDRVKLKYKPVFIDSVIDRNMIISADALSVDMWRINQLYTHHISIGSPILSIKITDHPNFSPRGVLLTRDACVHIISPMNGELLSSAVNFSHRKICDMAYSIEENILFCAFHDGAIAKFDTRTNPAKKVCEWPCGNAAAKCNYMIMYEYVINSTTTTSNDPYGPGGTGSKTLLMCGRQDGYICVLDWLSGAVEFEIEAHGSKGVLKMLANASFDQVISSGADNMIKVWRVFPFAQESLAPLMSFFCAHTPTSMSIIKLRILVAFQEPSTASYSVVLYNLEDKNRSDHSPDDDHYDTFTGASACARMKLFATSSLDGTIRIWNEHNQLVRVLHLHGTPRSVSFCSERGDLLIGIDNHLHFVNHQKYLPKIYLRKMIMMVFKEIPEERFQAFDEVALKLLGEDGMKRLNLVQSASKDLTYHDVLDKLEETSMIIERQIKEEAFELLDRREAELRLIRDGQLKPKRTGKSSKKNHTEAFERYMKIFYNRPKIALPRDPIIEKEADEALFGRTKARSPTWKKEEPSGFFPEISEARYCKDFVTPAGGLIPNSVLVKLLFPAEVREESMKKWEPAELDMEQLALLNDFKKKQATLLTESERTMIFDWGGDEDAKEAGEAEEEEELVLFELEADRKKKEVEEKEEQSGFMQRMTQIIEKAATPEPQLEPEPSIESTKSNLSSQSHPRKLTKEDMEKYHRKSTTAKPAPVVRRPLIRKVDTPPTEEFKSSSPETDTNKDRDSVATPRRPISPQIPTFVTQFQGESWFDKHYKAPLTMAKLPQPLNHITFCADVLTLFAEADWEQRCGLLNAVLHLYQQESIGSQNTFKAKLAVMAAFQSAPTLSKNSERRFVETALNFIAAFNFKDRDIICEVLVWYFEGDDRIQNLVMNVLEALGKADPHSYFVKELESWDSMWPADGPVGRHNLILKTCSDWLNKWLVKFKITVKDTIERMKKGENVTSEVGPIGASENTRARADSKVFTVTLDKPPDAAVADSATFIDAINYFCEIMHQKKLAKLRAPRKKEEASQDKIRNTVMILPQVERRACLVRLGESHAVPHRKREVQITHQDGTQPAAMQPIRRFQQTMNGGFTPIMHLPMKAVFLNPFFNAMDELEQETVRPTFINLRCSQKYFIPSLSCPQ